MTTLIMICGSNLAFWLDLMFLMSGKEHTMKAGVHGLSPDPGTTLGGVSAAVQFDVDVVVSMLFLTDLRSRVCDQCNDHFSVD